MKIIEDKNYKFIFYNDNVLIIPTTEKPLKMVFQDKYEITKTEEDGVYTFSEKLSFLELIHRVEAAGNDTYEFIDTLIREGKWEGYDCIKAKQPKIRTSFIK